MLDPDEILRRRGDTLHGRGGEPLGSVEEVFLDDVENRPTWALVHTAEGRRFVPLGGATLDGGHLAVPHDPGTVTSAPAVGSVTSLSPEDEATLYEHYEGRVPGAGAGNAGVASGGGGGGGGGMVRSEEELRVSTVRRVARRVRIRKEIVTEEEHLVVPVRKEVLLIEEVEARDLGDADEASAARPFEPLEVILSAEEISVVTRVVPVERVRVSVERVQVEQEISTDVRREQVDLVPSEAGLVRGD